MTKLDEADRAEAADRGREQLEQALVEAHYLGHSMRMLAANPDFSFRQITASVCEPLIAWAKFVEDRLVAGERPFAPLAARSARARK